MSRLILQVSALFKSFGSTPLFEDIALSIHEGDLFALIGANGSGKTTLMQILAGMVRADSARITQAAGLSVAFLPQEIRIANPHMAVRTYIEGDTFARLEQKMECCLADFSRLAEWAELHDDYERMGGYRRIPAEQVLCGLKFDSSLLDLPMSKLSSGQRVRAALAAVLIQNPDLLLLDEPTNHLDSEMLQWLEMMLKARSGASVIVSHDRAFLNNVCTRLVEIKEGKLSTYGGNYDFYLEEQERRLERDLKAYEEQQEKRAVLKQKIKAMTFSQSKPTPAKDRNIMAYDKRGESYQKSQRHKLETLKGQLTDLDSQRLSHPCPKGIKGLRFDIIPLSSPVAIELEDVGKSFLNRFLFAGFSKNLCAGDRLIVKGPNGCGKTTLLKIIAGLILPDSGRVSRSPSVRIAFLDQEIDSLPFDQTPFEYLQCRFGITEELLQRELHKAALGDADLVYRPFSTMSSGERKRIMLLTLMLDRPNVLLLDEPTNHLDLMTLEAFEKALLQFEGVIVAVSHDKRFISKIATVEWVLSNGESEE